MTAAKKQTLLGPIPHDWACEELEAFTSFISYGFTNPMPTTQSGPYMVTAADVSDGRINYSTARRTSTEAFEAKLTSKSKPRKNDVLLTKDGALGRVALVGDETICINQSVAILRPNKRIDPLFFSHLLQSDLYQKKMLEDAGGSTIKHIYITIVNRMPIVVPASMAEQHAIAAALSDADGLVAGLERVIAKKRLIKLGAMQDLLTARRRLPGFSGEWGVKLLAEISNIFMAPSKTGMLTKSGSFLVCDMGAVDRNGELIAIKTTDCDFDMLQAGDLVMPKDDIGGGQIIGRAGYVPTSGTHVLGDHVYGIRLRDGVPKFIAAIINSSRINSEIKKKVVGSAQLGLGRAAVSSQPLPWPESNEQQAIAAVLSDMDAEIQTLESRLAKARAVKEGMMQSLLTGRVRLV